MFPEKLKLKFENAAAFLSAGIVVFLTAGMSIGVGLEMAGFRNESICFSSRIIDTVISMSSVSSWKECIVGANYVSNEKSAGQYVGGFFVVGVSSAMSFLGIKGMKMAKYAFKNDLKIIINNKHSLKL